MKNFICLIFVIAVFTNSSFAQKRFNKNDFVLKLAPFALVDYYPAIELSGAYFLSQKSVVQLKISQKTNWVDLQDKYSMRGNRLSFEIQQYLGRKIYTGLEFGYMKNKYSDNMSYIPNKGETTWIKDEFLIDRQRFYLVPKFGLTAFCSNKISLDLYTGFGLQYQKKEVKNLEFDPSKGHRDGSGYVFFGPTYKEKEGLYAKFSLGFMINYKINK